MKCANPKCKKSVRPRVVGKQGPQPELLLPGVRQQSTAAAMA
jgi:hypothetical protein